jgi:hypothetical protein
MTNDETAGAERSSPSNPTEQEPKDLSVGQRPKTSQPRASEALRAPPWVRPEMGIALKGRHNERHRIAKPRSLLPDNLILLLKERSFLAGPWNLTE